MTVDVDLHTRGGLRSRADRWQRTAHQFECSGDDCAVDSEHRADAAVAIRPPQPGDPGLFDRLPIGAIERDALVGSDAHHAHVEVALAGPGLQAVRSEQRREVPPTGGVKHDDQDEHDDEGTAQSSPTTPGDGVRSRIVLSRGGCVVG